MYKKLISILLCLCLVWGVAMATETTEKNYYTSEEDIVSSTNSEVLENTDIDLLPEDPNNEGTLLSKTLDALDGYDLDDSGNVYYTNADGTQTLVLEDVDEQGNPGTVSNIEGVNTYTANIPVTVQIADEDQYNEDVVYNVEIVWGALYFGWGALGTGTNEWNVDEHTYTVVGEDGEEVPPKWYLLSSEPLDPNYSDLTDDEGRTGVEWVEEHIDTTQAHVLVFNHSNRPVIIAAQLNDIEDVGARMVPIYNSSMSVPEGLIKDLSDANAGTYSTQSDDETNYQGDTKTYYTTCMFDLAEGVQDQRYHQLTTAVMEVELIHAKPDELSLTTKTPVATMTITLVEDGHRKGPTTGNAGSESTDTAGDTNGTNTDTSGTDTNGTDTDTSGTDTSGTDTDTSGTDTNGTDTDTSGTDTDTPETGA